MNAYLFGKIFFSPVLSTNSKYISYVWIVFCFCIFTSSNISVIYETVCFRYFSDILHVPHNFPVHLTILLGESKYIILLVSFEMRMQRCSAIAVVSHVSGNT